MSLSYAEAVGLSKTTAKAVRARREARKTATAKHVRRKKYFLDNQKSRAAAVKERSENRKPPQWHPVKAMDCSCDEAEREAARTRYRQLLMSLALKRMSQHAIRCRKQCKKKVAEVTKTDWENKVGFQDGETCSLAVLGITVDCHTTLAEVKKAYRSQARKYHPDKNPSAPDWIFQTIDRVYNETKDKVNGTKPPPKQEHANLRITSTLDTAKITVRVQLPNQSQLIEVTALPSELKEAISKKAHIPCRRLTHTPSPRFVNSMRNRRSWTQVCGIPTVCFAHHIRSSWETVHGRPCNRSPVRQNTLTS